MAKLIFLFVTLALFVLIANARTVVEVDVEDEDNQQFGRCRREFQEHRQLRACQQYMRRRAHRGGGGQWGDELELEVEADDGDDNEDENQQRRPVLRQCCYQLRQVDRPCICPVLRQAAQQQRYQGQIQGPEQVRRLFQAARNLPNICNLPVGHCPFGAW